MTKRSSSVRSVLEAVTPLEWLLGGAVVLVLTVLAVLEPAILEAPFENWRTMVFAVGGTLLAGVLAWVMLARRVPSPVRILVLGVPFVIVSWWLLSPFFVDDVADDEFATSIAAARAVEDPGPATSAPAPSTGDTSADAPPPRSAAPVLLGAGSFVGLAGHEGSGDAGIFRLANGSHVLRFERFDIQNGPDLEVYLVPGSDLTLTDDAVHLGHLRGNVGDQTYEVPDDLEVIPGPWTALVWCEAFSVDFVGAVVDVA